MWDKYNKFFFHYLQYCSENTTCCCFWPELCSLAVDDSNLVYNLIKELADCELIDYRFSSDWIGRDVIWLWDRKLGSEGYFKHYTSNYYPSSHGIASSLLTYTFFYSQYYQMLMDVAEFIDENTLIDDPNALDKIYQVLEKIRENFVSRYNVCLKIHPHSKIFYERGMLNMHSGKTEAALEDIQSMIELANDNQDKDESPLAAEMYHQEGQAYAELGQYDNAIRALTEAIKRNPKNKDVYFHRAAAYFEKGEFDSALADFLLSNKEPTKSGFFSNLEFQKALSLGILRGTAEATTDFIPSMCGSIYGLSMVLWDCAKEPTRSYENFVKCCWDMADVMKEHCQTVDWDTIKGYSHQVRDLYKRYHALSDQEKGDLIGYTIARYGVDIFLGSAALKAVHTYKKLKNANTLCNMEAALVSSAKEQVIARAIVHAQERQKYFASVRVQWNHQNKHIQGSHNFDPNRGRITVSKDKLEELIKQHAGKGHKINDIHELAPDFRERVDFKEIIGEYAKKETGKPTEFFPTTKGILRYSKKGVHLTPANL